MPMQLFSRSIPHMVHSEKGLAGGRKGALPVEETSDHIVYKNLEKKLKKGIEISEMIICKESGFPIFMDCTIRGFLCLQHILLPLPDLYLKFWPFLKYMWMSRWVPGSTNP